MGVVDHRTLDTQPVSLWVITLWLRRLLVSASGNQYQASRLGAGKTQRPIGLVILLQPPQRWADREDRAEGFWLL